MMEDNTYADTISIRGFYVNEMRRAGDPGSNPGPGENFSPKLLIPKLTGNLFPIQYF